jgi:hypothetical protein
MNGTKPLLPLLKEEMTNDVRKRLGGFIEQFFKVVLE